MFIITKIDLIREKDGQSKNWGFQFDNEVKDLEQYREYVKQKFNASTVLFTFTEVSENDIQNPETNG